MQKNRRAQYEDAAQKNFAQNNKVEPAAKDAAWAARAGGINKRRQG